MCDACVCSLCVRVCIIQIEIVRMRDPVLASFIRSHMQLISSVQAAGKVRCVCDVCVCDTDRAAGAVWTHPHQVLTPALQTKTRARPMHIAHSTLTLATQFQRASPSLCTALQHY